MGTDSAILAVMVRESQRIAELERQVSEQESEITELRKALSRAATGDAPARHP